MWLSVRQSLRIFITDLILSSMIHMPDIKKPNGESFPYCLPNDYECADKQLDFLVSADNAACVCETPCEVVR